MPDNTINPGLAFALALVLASVPLFTTGCTAKGTHQVIALNEQCESCHSQPMDTYEPSQPSSAVPVGETMTVRTSEPQVLLCKPRFVSEDGSDYVPVEWKRFPVEGGSAEVILEEGVWCLAIDKGDSSKTALVSCSAENSPDTAIDL